MLYWKERHGELQNELDRMTAVLLGKSEELKDALRIIKQRDAFLSKQTEEIDRYRDEISVKDEALSTQRELHQEMEHKLVSMVTEVW